MATTACRPGPAQRRARIGLDGPHPVLWGAGHGATYDPIRRTWHRVPALDVGGDSTGLRTDNDGFVYDEGSWQPIELLPTQSPYSVGDVVWTGDHIVFEPNGIECSCGGIPGSSTGSWVDPADGRVRAIPPYQAGPPYAEGSLVWTGGPLLADGRVTKALDPHTGRWRPVPKPPRPITGLRIWAGDRLFVWGGPALEFGP